MIYKNLFLLKFLTKKYILIGFEMKPSFFAFSKKKRILFFSVSLYRNL